MYYVLVTWDGEVVMSQTLERGLVTVGRSPTNRVVLPDPEVGWHHCILWAENRQPWLREVGSAGGTWVDGERVEGPALLAPTSRVRIGQRAELGVRPLATSAPRRARWLLRDVGSGVMVDVTAAMETAGADSPLLLHHARPPLRVTRIEQGLRIEADRRAVVLAPGAQVSVGGHSLGTSRWAISS
jgi:FHA domain